MATKKQEEMLNAMESHMQRFFHKETENEMTPEEALNNIAIAMVENFVGKDEPRRTQQIKRFLNSNECQIIEQSFDERENQKQILKVLKKKEVDIFLVSITDCVEEYNELLGGNRKKYPLTETEFDLIKEWLK